MLWDKRGRGLDEKEDREVYNTMRKMMRPIIVKIFEPNFYPKSDRHN